MRTVSTKLDKSDHERFVNLCNQEGCSVSETIRDMIQQWCDASEEDVEDSTQQKPQEQIKPIPETKEAKIIKSSDNIDESKSHYDKFGNYWTFDKKTDKWTCHLDPKNIKS